MFVYIFISIVSTHVSQNYKLWTICHNLYKNVQKLAATLAIDATNIVPYSNFICQMHCIFVIKEPIQRTRLNYASCCSWLPNLDLCGSQVWFPPFHSLLEIYIPCFGVIKSMVWNSWKNSISRFSSIWRNFTAAFCCLMLFLYSESTEKYLLYAYYWFLS